MKRTLLLVVLLLFSLVVPAQVTFSARVYFPPEVPIEPIFFKYQPFCLKVDNEDTVRYCYCDSTATIRFDNIAVGSLCHLIYRDFMYSYDYPVFTITADTYIDSLVMRRTPKEKIEEMFRTKTEKDRARKSQAAQWSLDVEGRDTFWYDENDFWLDDEPHSLKLARLYYADWVAPLATWRTWPHVADSAYRYCLLASKQYPYLYYPLRQLAHHLGKTQETKPPKDPNEHTYLPQPMMPDKWWTDTTADLFTPWAIHTQKNTYARESTLGKAHEKSLCYPLAADGTIRYTETCPFSGILICRVEGGRMYHKRLGWGKRGMTDNETCTLTAEGLDSVATAMAAFQRAGRPEDESGNYVIDGCHYVLEYIIDGHYHRYTTSSGAVPPELEAIKELLHRIYKRNE